MNWLIDMTLYTYRCPKCGDFEEFREENDRKMCECGQPVKKTFGSAFKLYGPGFYTTDTSVEKAFNRKT